GWAHFGISASGAADALAFRAANLLVGNHENAPALEMTLSGGEFEFEGGALIALTGSEFRAGAPLWTPVEMRSGQTLRCGSSRTGAGAVRAVGGGFVGRRVGGGGWGRGRGGVGGGRPRRGAGRATGGGGVGRPRPPARTPPVYHPRPSLRVTPGPQAAW